MRAYHKRIDDLSAAIVVTLHCVRIEQFIGDRDALAAVKNVCFYDLL